MLITVYAIKNKDGSVSIFRDKELKTYFCIFDKHHSKKPTKRNKRIILNCWQWQLQWV